MLFVLRSVGGDFHLNSDDIFDRADIIGCRYRNLDLIGPYRQTAR